ncbi:kanamycin kinase [uncultured Anaerococcus sp.]|uniref:kanamycin kinase n=1 Tax=uncultured Anaerococcus sp. TaxID=293428 RepID=UPI0025E97B34|nr:kanamycin kinase [uncultured Anaerococcus sp.]
MLGIIEDQIKKLNYFKNNDLIIKDIINLNEEMYKIITQSGDFILHIFHKNSYDKLMQLSIKNQSTIKTGTFDKNHYYEISEYRDLTSLNDYLINNSKKNNYEMGMKFGRILKQIHSITPEEKINWFDFFNTKANYLFYMHGVNEDIGDDDYILIDYINHNKHLTKSICPSYIFNSLDLSNIYLDEKGNLIMSGINFTKVGDGVYDFVNLNDIGLKNSEFTRGCFDGYFENRKAPIKFFRLLALYEAYNILYNIVAHREGKPSIYSLDDLKELLTMYDNFNTDIPNWIKEGD